MAEQGEEIKNLFQKLGLDPSHYQQIPASSATAVGAPPPRWTLLQPATTAIQPVVIAPAPAVLAAVATTPAAPKVRKPELPPPDAISLSDLSAALLGAAQDIVRAETAAQPELEEESAPSAMASALSQVSPAEGLQSLFQSVKESQAVAYHPSGREDVPTERPTIRLPSDGLKVASRPVPSREATQTLHSSRSALRPARVGSRLGPKPGATTRLESVRDPVTAPVVPTVIEGRLQFSAPAPEGVQGESLSDVFRRLSRPSQ